MAGPGTPGWAVPAGEDYLVRRVADLERAQREGMASIAASFGPIVARLEATDVEILAQQATLADQVATIAGLVAAQVTAAGNSAIVNGATIGSAWTNVLTTTIPAPAWSGKALISASGSVTATAQGGPAIIQARIGIDGAYSDIFEWIAQLSGDQLICSPISFRDYDPGATVTVTLDARRTAGASGTVLGRLVATGTFLRL